MNRAISPTFVRACLCGAASLIVPEASAQVIFTSNLRSPIDGIERITNTRWLGSQFSTDGRTYLLGDVLLRLQRNVPGTLEAAIYSDAGGRPGQLIAVLTQNGQIAAFPNDVVFRSRDGGTTQFQSTQGRITMSGSFSAPDGVEVADFPAGEFVAFGDRPSGLILSPNTTYWVVTRALSGEFASAYTDRETGQGIGYSPVWAQSNNAGGSWLTQGTSPLFLQASGDPTVALVELRTDLEAIQSTVFSALPMALAQRELVFSAVAETTRDINARLFRLRTGQDVERGWELFAAGKFGAVDMEAIQFTTGFQSDSVAATVGAEYHFNQYVTFGAAVTAFESDASLGRGVGDVKLSGPALAAYISLVRAGFYADFLYSFTMLDHEMRRDTLFGETAHAAPNSETHTLELNIGHVFEVNGFVMGPLAGLTYSTGDLDSYVESGAGTKNVAVGGQGFDSLVSRLGWHVSRPFQWGGVEVIPQIHLAWRHEFLNDADLVTAELLQSPFMIGGGDTFQRVGQFNAASWTEAPTQDALEVGAAVAVQVSERARVILQYQASIFQEDGVAHGVSLTGSFNF